MKFVINACYGGFSIKKSVAKAYGFDPYCEERDNSILIKLIESGVDCNGSCAELKIVDIPDDATDYEFDEYDGYESITYVVDGKIYHAS